MTIILTNDDGIDAPGLRSLFQVATTKKLKNVAIVAPQLPHSGCGHQVTTDRPFQLERRSLAEFAVGGTPADCTRVSISHLFPDDVEWVLSGINPGGNLGADVYISGTVAAVREAALHRIPGIAISHYIQQKRPIDWDLAAQLSLKVLDKLMSCPSQPGTYWNVNLPHLDTHSPEPEIIVCPLCTQPLPAAYRLEADHFYYAGDYSQRVRDPGSDVEVCFSGQISATLIEL